MDDRRDPPMPAVTAISVPSSIPASPRSPTRVRRRLGGAELDVRQPKDPIDSPSVSVRFMSHDFRPARPRVPAGSTRPAPERHDEADRESADHEREHRDEDDSSLRHPRVPRARGRESSRGRWNGLGADEAGDGIGDDLVVHGSIFWPRQRPHPGPCPPRARPDRPRPRSRRLRRRPPVHRRRGRQRGRGPGRRGVGSTCSRLASVRRRRSSLPPRRPPIRARSPTGTTTSRSCWWSCSSRQRGHGTYLHARPPVPAQVMPQSPGLLP